MLWSPNLPPFNTPPRRYGRVRTKEEIQNDLQALDEMTNAPWQALKWVLASALIIGFGLLLIVIL